MMGLQASYLENRWDSQFKNSQSQKKINIEFVGLLFVAHTRKKGPTKVKNEGKGPQNFKNDVI